MNDKVTFQESKIITITILLFVAGAMFSIIPEGNPMFFFVNISLAMIAGLLFYVFWRKWKHASIRYFSLLSFVMINVFAIYFAMPLLRLFYPTVVFWIGVFILIVMNVLPYFFSRAIAFGVQRPNKSILGKIYIVYAFLIMLFGSIIYSNSLYTQYTDAFLLAVILFLFSILFFFLSPIMLIKPETMKKILNK